MKSYQINEIFYAPQGEGVRAGTMNVFVRFSGCNLECAMAEGPRSPGGFDCDTEFASGRKLTAEEVLAEAVSLWPVKETASRAVIFSGGEPTLQLDRELVEMFGKAGFFTCIETNGTIDTDPLDLDWVACSPKVAEHAVKVTHADELRYVRGHGQGIPRPTAKAANLLISPAFEATDLAKRNLEWCLRLVSENPSWRLSVQMHKLWRCR